MNHQANGSPVDHFDTPLDLFKGLDELGGKNENMCIFTHPIPYPTFSLNYRLWHSFHPKSSHHQIYPKPPCPFREGEIGIWCGDE
jgi:hypothetical protein